MKNKKLVQIGAIAMSVALGMSPFVPAMAATSAVTTNNTATANDLNNADIIDESRTGSLSIHKYDITSAEAAGKYTEGLYKATGEKDTRVENALKNFGVEGVQFSYLRVGDVETHSINNGTNTTVTLVYEIPEDLAKILNLTAADAIDMTSIKEAHPCTHTGVCHYTSQQISDALATILKADDLSAKNALENYLYDYGTQDSTTDQATKPGVVNMPKTDKYGYTHVDELELGLYLVVETEVPEQVVSTVNPWFVQVPFTNTTSDTTTGGQKWLYDMTCYPKNQTGNPTLDKNVRNAYSNSSETDKNGALNIGKDYVTSSLSNSLIVYNNDSNTVENTADADAATYIANRGGYTKDGITAGKDGAGYSYDYEYRDTTTASEGDVLDYTLLSKLPHITTKATYLSEYTFYDKLSKGISYNEDAKIAFYDNAEDAKANNTKNAALLWDSAGTYFTREYKNNSDGTKEMTVKLTEAGLEVVNHAGVNNSTATNATGLSDYYMVVYYTANVNSDASVVLGDQGNPNDVRLVWNRTSDSYYNMLEDRNYVYSYAMDLTKTFSDNKGDYSNVKFKMYNSTDSYYVVAEKKSDGLYYVTGKTTDENKATEFTPDANGALFVNGIEADTYQLTEVATDDGYNLLKDQIKIKITATDRDVIASVAGATGMDAETVANIVANYNGGIYDENGNLVTGQVDEITGDTGNTPADETANGRTIGKTDMYVGAIQCASAVVDGIDANMTQDNASVILTVNNTKSFLLPKTGGNGLYVATIVGVVAVAGGCYLVTRKKHA